MQQWVESCYVQRLFGTLLDDESLHIHSQKTKYRNKITYNLPLRSNGDFSDLASDCVNDVCRAAQAWSSAVSIDGKCITTLTAIKEVNSHDTLRSAVQFREIMVKATREGNMLVRLTIASNRHRTDEHGSITTELDWPDAMEFRNDMQAQFPSIVCLCYNVADESKVARPSKESPLVFLTEDMVVTEITPSGLEYEIGPDTFSEVNHEVEVLQWEKTKEWLEGIMVPTIDTMDETKPPRPRILIVSGRDISSFGLSFGSLLLPASASKAWNGTFDNTDECAPKHLPVVVRATLFDRVVAIQHCPLVHRDAIRNFERHKNKVRATVRHMSKVDMVRGFEEELTKCSCSRTGQRPLVVGVMTGGRKGLDASYIDYLVHNTNVIGIIYNSCSTTSLIRDMQGFVQAGFAVDDFRSYDFLPGTGYTASLTKLVRRPRTLILPIGPAGVGKSYLAASLARQYSRHSILWWNRDEIFSALRQQGTGLAKSKQLVHHNLLVCLQTLKNAKNGNLLSTPTVEPSIVIVDSTNGNADARRLYVRESEPDRVVMVVFNLKNANTDEVIAFLLQRTSNRLGDNVCRHPSFPNSPLRQRDKHIKILQGIDYHDMSIAHHQGNSAFFEETSSLIVHCDPREEELSAVSYKVFLCCSVQATLRNRFDVS